MNKNDLISRLISEFGYPKNGAQIIAEKLENCSPQVQKAFTSFWDSGELSTIEVEGYTISRLAEEQGMKPIAALLTIDWLVRDPERAKKSLIKGHDILGKSNR